MLLRPTLVLGTLALASWPAFAQCEVYQATGLMELPLDKSQFGRSVSLREDRMAVGMVWSSKPGEVRIYDRSASGWLLATTVKASDGTPGDADAFGYSVAIESDTLIIGAHQHGFLDAEGSAFVFERQSDGTWIETQILLPPESDTFAMGWAVALEGDRMVVGAKGASIGSGKGKAFVYERSESGWVKTKTIKPVVGGVGDGFGAALALQGNRLVVGAPYGWSGASTGAEGRAYVYEYGLPGPAWVLKKVFFPADLKNADLFGQDVALDGDTILVGAPQHDLPVMHAGAVYEFQLVGGIWSQTGKLSTEDLSPNINFGWSLDLAADRAVIGARFDDSVGTESGAAYVFERGAGGWSQVSKFHGSDLLVGDTFGHAVDVEGSEVLIGAPNIATGEAGPGTAHLFSFEPGPHLLADADAVSVSQGGIQNHQLGACAEHAGDLFLLAGSTTGTSPGFTFSGLPVPLNPDAYFLFTVNHPGTPPLAGSFGLLDAFGLAEASFSLPPGSAATLAGLVVNHAYAVLDGATLQLEAVSPAVAVLLDP